MLHCSVNYEIKPESEASISINERGFLFGDGVFETCRIANSKIYNSENHFKRLESGLKAIKIDFDLSKLEENINKLISKNNVINGLARLYISRGNGSIGYCPKENIKPLIIIQTKELPEQPKSPIKLWVSKITKPSINSLPINHKLAQGLNSTLAKIEAKENNCFDSLLLNEESQICETSSANIFWIKDNILYTPAKECGILLGTTRQKIIELSKIPVKEMKANLNELSSSQEVFISNASYGILKIDEISPNNTKFTKDTHFNKLEQLLKKDISN